MTSKQHAVLWIGLALIIVRLLTTQQGADLLSLLTGKPEMLGKRVNI